MQEENNLIKFCRPIRIRFFTSQSVGPLSVGQVEFFILVSRFIFLAFEIYLMCCKKKKTYDHKNKNKIYWVIQQLRFITLQIIKKLSHTILKYASLIVKNLAIPPVPTAFVILVLHGILTFFCKLWMLYSLLLAFNHKLVGRLFLLFWD